MVSTRSIRFKFSEGERVLCYEPDPTKAKVLYDSKVLEVIESKDKRGRRTVEYLIHFQGWNSSWDRCVSEDFVLKDTEENRQLQRDLADKSQLQLGAYLYRRERKKGSSSTAGAGPAKRARHGFSDDGSSSSTQPDEVEGETAGDTDSSSGSVASQPPSPPHAQLGRAQISLPAPLRDRLTFDYHLVVKRGRVSRLPACPCAAQILEAFVKRFARAGAWHVPRRADPPHRPNLLDVSCKLNLVREVADGLRVYFDFILRGHLLYKQELPQYQELCGQYINEPEQETKVVLEEDSAPSQEEGRAEEELKSPKVPEYWHLPPDPVDETSQTSTTPSRQTINQSECLSKEVELELTSKEPVQDENLNPALVYIRRPRANLRANLARRLRSHKSVVSQQSENDDPAPSTSACEPRPFETMSSSLGSSGSSLSEGWTQPRPSPAATTSTRTPLSLLLDKVAKWQIIPREGTEHLPSRVYGAIHLARLFVKLPDFLNSTQMPDFKLKLIIKHIDMFVQFLDEHSEWFGEMYYVADGTSRSH